MNKNLIYIVGIDHPTSQFKVSSYANPCFESWQLWANKHNIDIHICKEHDDRFARPIWNKELVFEKFGDRYDKIGIVDADTIVRWDAPNIFDLYTEEEFCGVRDNDNFWWLDNSIKAYQKFFPTIKLDTDYYINAGVIFFSKKHKPVFDAILKFYFDNKQEIDNWSVPNTGREQTIFNFILEQLQVKKKLISPEWNQFGLVQKGFFNYNFSTGDTTPYIFKNGFIWHFTGFPIEQRIELMNKIWTTIKTKYE